MSCRYCGSELPEEALFCGECGRAVLVESLVGVGSVSEGTGSRDASFARFAPAGTSFSNDAFSDDAVSDDAVSDDSGRRMADPIVAEELLCPQCGTIVDDSDVFCGECGFVLKATMPTGPRDSAADEPARDEPVETPWPFAQDVAAAEPEPEPELAPEPEAEAEAEAAPEPEPEAAAPEPEPEPEPSPLTEPPVSESDSQPRKDPNVDNENETEAVAPVGGRARTIPDPFPWGADIEDSEEDVEATRIVSANGGGDRFVLQFSTGESVTVSGAGLIGRNPAAQPGEYVDQLVSIFDVGKSVSKTHLEFGQEGGRVWVSDRYSTNGSIVRQPEAEARRCEPGRRYFVVRGTRIDVGEQFFVVS
jgi:hypothetical protein